MSQRASQSSKTAPPLHLFNRNKVATVRLEDDILTVWAKSGRTANAVSSCSCNAAALPHLLPSVITSVVHDHAAPVAHYLGAIDC